MANAEPAYPNPRNIGEGHPEAVRTENREDESSRATPGAQHPVSAVVGESVVRSPAAAASRPPPTPPHLRRIAQYLKNPDAVHSRERSPRRPPREGSTRSSAGPTDDVARFYDGISIERPTTLTVAHNLETAMDNALRLLPLNGVRAHVQYLLDTHPPPTVEES